MTKESTYLLHDIYNEVQTTLKKYDEIIKETQMNKQKQSTINNNGSKKS